MIGVDRRRLTPKERGEYYAKRNRDAKAIRRLRLGKGPEDEEPDLYGREETVEAPKGE